MFVYHKRTYTYIYIHTMRISIVNNLALFIGMLQVNFSHNLTIDGKLFFFNSKKQLQCS